MKENVRFWRLLGDLVEEGVPILTSLDRVREALGEARIKSAIERMRRCICDGDSFTLALQEYPDLLPPGIARAIEQAEEGIDLSALALAIADVLEREDFARLGDLFPGRDFR